MKLKVHYITPWNTLTKKPLKRSPPFKALPAPSLSAQLLSPPVISSIPIHHLRIRERGVEDREKGRELERGIFPANPIFPFIDPCKLGLDFQARSNWSVLIEFHWHQAFPKRFIDLIELGFVGFVLENNGGHCEVIRSLCCRFRNNGGAENRHQRRRKVEGWRKREDWWFADEQET